MREIYKKIEKIISEWIQPILDKRIEDDGRWTQSAWKGGHHWELSQDRFTIPRLLTLVQDVTCIRVLISSTKRFNTSELRSIVERDNNEVIIITRTNISFNEYCKFDHFSKEEMMDLYNRIKDESGSDNLGVWGRDAISDYAVHAAEKVPAEWLQGYLGEKLPEKSVDAIHSISGEILSTLDLMEEKKAALNNAIESGESAESWFAKEAMNESGSNGSKARVAAEFFNGITTANNTYENVDENELIDVDNETWDDDEWNDYRLKDSLKEVAVEAGKAGMREIASEAFMKASEKGKKGRREEGIAAVFKDSEFVQQSLEKGAVTGLKVAVSAGLMTVAEESGVLPPSTFAGTTTTAHKTVESLASFGDVVRGRKTLTEAIVEVKKHRCFNIQCYVCGRNVVLVLFMK